MNECFYNCSSLTSLNINNFNTSKATNMSFMFCGCNSLKELNLSLKFITSKVTNMSYMFANCNSLTSLDISNFDIFKVKDLRKMFLSCTNLEYLNIHNFYKTPEMEIDDMFYGIPENTLFCYNNHSEEMDEIRAQIIKKKCYVEDCSSYWVEKKKNYIFETDSCFISCEKNKIFLYEYENNCYIECPDGTYIDKDYQYKCKKEILVCPNNYPFQKVEDRKCTNICRGIDFFNTICSINNPNLFVREEIINTIINDIKDGSMNSILENLTLLNQNYNQYNQSDIIIEINDIIYQITTPYNQNNNIYNNLSSINLGQCEKILKEQYQINNDENLIIFNI